ncbi:SDR family oxidoreductase [Piscinibacter gummiphilus]|uniref:SDR family oxidoreductase n=1 Tax=Piscinibacter gummiphilus TaxID=946333 RepID=A0ABZ0D0Z4_9BURK|nr:SDR family oxidoreductase [Piscinibacter gummiphilus]WOB08399.1 SDR family oxidoreductase [Piscinibacter gummiphilus]
MNLAPTDLDPSRAMHPETLGHAPGRGRLHGRRVLVVGAGQRVIPEEDPPIGNGRAISVLFAREGAQVACVDVNAEAAQATVDQITSEGGKAFAEMADVLDVQQIAPLVARVAEKMGGLDGLVLNVGISHGLPLDRITPETWDKEYGVNVKSHMFFSQAALPLMSPGGSIVLMSSLASLRNASRNPTYESAKAAQVSLARAIAVAGEPKGIRCNAVLPGLMDTPMGRDASRRRPNRALAVPFGRQGTGWEVAYATLFLISHESTYVNGHALLADGGLSIGVIRSPG